MRPGQLSEGLAGIVQQQLGQHVMKHVPKLGGVLLAFDGVQMIGDGLGKVLWDRPWVHMEAQVRLLLFCPRVGDVLSEWAFCGPAARAVG